MCFLQVNSRATENSQRGNRSDGKEIHNEDRLKFLYLADKTLFSGELLRTRGTKEAENSLLTERDQDF